MGVLRKLFFICLIFLSIPSFSQIKIDYFYRPARMELETDLSYSYANWTIGFKYNEENNYFRLNDNYVVHSYVQIPLTDYLKWELVYGIKCDYEASLLFEFPKIKFEIGYSKTGLLVEFDFIWKEIELQKVTNF